MSANSFPDDNDGIRLVGVEDMVEVYQQRRAVSSGEPSLDGSVDEERGALSDSDLPGAVRVQTLATQAKGPSSDALEVECRAEHSLRTTNADGSSNAEWNDVLGSGHLFTKVLRSGTGPKPRNGQQVTIRVIDRKLGLDSVEKQTFVLGFSMVIDAWELVVQLMNEGEMDIVKAECRFAYGSAGDPSRNIPPYQPMEYSIELLEVGDALSFSSMPRDSLVAYISKLKERGNYYYTRREFDKAIFVYKRCTDVVNIPEDDEVLRNMFSVIYSNLAVCHAKLCDWKMTLDTSDKALKLNASNTKALFRRASAYTNLNFIDEAIETLKTASAIDPDDVLITKELRRLKGRQRLCREQERSLYKRMLAGARGDEDLRGARHLTAPARYALLAFFVMVFASFIHFLRIYLGS
ncbi:binding protein [Toxocara canis]|uniref:peptidylprolyl isomerase n=1 Tax=Toxocara canis TaxID=6265 RepID=A0A0B2VSI5_TOXCA|nr:binding protein [Toxocara canis]